MRNSIGEKITLGLLILLLTVMLVLTFRLLQSAAKEDAANKEMQYRITAPRERYYFTNDFEESNGCVQGIERDGKQFRLCGTYTVNYQQ